MSGPLVFLIGRVRFWQINLLKNENQMKIFYSMDIHHVRYVSNQSTRERLLPAISICQYIAILDIQCGVG